MAPGSHTGESLPGSASHFGRGCPYGRSQSLRVRQPIASWRWQSEDALLIATDLLTPEERSIVIAEVPWRAEALRFAGQVFGSLRNQAVDLIDAAIGPNHVRAALVAVYEAADLIVQGSIELAESVACERFFQRETPRDPLGEGEELSDGASRARFPWRMSRYAIENACTHIVTAGDHMANAHIRLAWEINAATSSEVRACHFEPDQPEPKSWISTRDLLTGLRASRRDPLGVLQDFELNRPFFDYMKASRGARRYRNAVIHRDRPTYREIPALGRVTIWAQDNVTVQWPPQPDDKAPPLATYRELVDEALESLLSYANATWAAAIRWLPTVRVSIKDLGDKVEVSTGIGAKQIARESRDPGAFIRREARGDRDQ